MAGGKGHDKKLAALLSRIVADIRPSESEIAAASRYSNELMGRLRRVLPKDVEIILAGSVARGTQIRGASDIDIFLLFPKGVQERTMEAEALRVAKKIVSRKDGESYEINYAEHPYLKLINRKLGFTADIVPAFKIRDAGDMGTSVDRTQLHNEFVKAHLGVRQLDDVRLLKHFLDSHRIYGAEARVSGFSGYLCELLIYHYGSFIAAIEKLSALKLPLVIRILGNKEVTDSREVEAALKRFGSRFIVIDPTDSNRNVAANVSIESLSRLVMASRMLLRSPSVKSFYGPKIADIASRAWLSQLIKSYGFDVHTIAVKLPSISEDTLWPQLKRLAGSISGRMESEGFKPLLSLQYMDGNEAIMSFVTNRTEMNARVVEGPPVGMAEGAELFYKKHKHGSNVSIEGERLFSLESAQFPNAHELLSRLLTDSKFGFPSHIGKKHAHLFIGALPERYAKMLRLAYEIKMNV
ncbi:CCA tRNA nucleotidyltransferase [Candidatus Marsarchaeota archaeon]|jgi:tRNA nucleotidyltransferase (CCA-adding enzyme)|nr:CCA tRNA nucleotidyltransferase [Candidatus Marsarchaeota archaeon]